MFKSRTLLPLSFALVLLAGCKTLQDFAKMATFARCEFRLASVEDVTLSGIALQGKTKPGDFGFQDLLKLQGVLATGKLPLKFTANLDVRNPNSTDAAMNKLAWILYLDDTELSNGVLDQRVEVPANGSGSVPLVIAVDLRQVLSGKALNSMINLALNVSGEGTTPTRVTLKAKPSVVIEGQELDYPGYLTVTHEFSAQESKEVQQAVLDRLNQGLGTK
jgi:hypothetical protein